MYKKMITIQEFVIRTILSITPVVISVVKISNYTMLCYPSAKVQADIQMSSGDIGMYNQTSINSVYHQKSFCFIEIISTL